MTCPTARVIADSVSPAGHRLTTIEVRLHRFVLAELNTHRVFARNSASSRAIPLRKTIDQVMTDPALPLHWGANQPGMQADEQLSANAQIRVQQAWLKARNEAVDIVLQLDADGLHKQVANRLLEPFMWHTVIISATEWDGFWAQRCSPLAQPEMRAAAEAMRTAYDASEPTVRRPPFGGDLATRDDHSWHLPYVTDEDRRTLWIHQLKQVSVARCARVSYLTHEGRRSVEEDLTLYERLITARPMHASPLEHVARPAMLGEQPPGCFRGWAQLRHEVEEVASIE